MRRLLPVFCLLAMAQAPAPAPTPAPVPAPASTQASAPAPAPAPAASALTRTEATGVLGRMVRDADGKEIGRIVDVVVAPSGEPRAIVVDADGFLGVGARRVAVAWSTVHVPPPNSKDEDVSIDMTDSLVRTAPSYTDRTKPAMIVGPPVTPAAASARRTPGDSDPCDTGTHGLGARCSSPCDTGPRGPGARCSDPWSAIRRASCRAAGP